MSLELSENAFSKHQISSEEELIETPDICVEYFAGGHKRIECYTNRTFFTSINPWA